MLLIINGYMRAALTILVPTSTFQNGKEGQCHVDEKYPLFAYAKVKKRSILKRNPIDNQVQRSNRRSQNDCRSTNF